MALDADLLASIRRVIAEPTSAAYSDDMLETMYEGAGRSIAVLAEQVWTEKAASASSLVDVSEGQSSRKMSQIADSYLDMAKTWRDRAGVEGQSAMRSSGTRAIERM
jgi:hypothetical protein